MTGFGRLVVSSVYFFVKYPSMYRLDRKWKISESFTSNGKLRAYIIDLFQYLGVKTLAYRLPIQHSPKPPIFIEATSLPDSRISVEHPGEEGHDFLLYGIYQKV